MISFGTYQIEQARCYLSNHLYHGNHDMTLVRFFDEDVKTFCHEIINPDMDPLLLMTNLKSRFVSQIIHRTFVLINKNELGCASVLAYCCSCKAGNRTIGCCSHVMSLLYFVTYARNGISEVSKHLKDVFNNNNWENTIESSDDEIGAPDDAEMV